MRNDMQAMWTEVTVHIYLILDLYCSNYKAVWRLKHLAMKGPLIID